MGRPLDEEIAYPDEMAKAYFRGEKHAIVKELGFPPQSSHMRLTARSTAPTPEDPLNDYVGRFIKQVIKANERTCLELYYDRSLTPYLRARALGISPRRFDQKRRDLLLQLKGFLAAVA